MTTELFLSPIIQYVAVTKLIAGVEGQLNLVWGYEGELRSFCERLEGVKGVLQRAELQPATGYSDLEVWLKGLRRITDEADNLVDLITYETLRPKPKVTTLRQMPKQVSYLFTLSNPLIFRCWVVNKIKKLSSALDKLNNQAMGLALPIKSLEPRVIPDGIQQTDSFLADASEFEGREGDVQKIVQLLINSSNDQPLRVTSIVGIPGLGKTTLAKLVYNNQQIQTHFSKTMWVYVSVNFDVKNILDQMLESLTEVGCENNKSQDAVAKKIKNMLSNKNYFLVLDDVGNVDRQKWGELRNSLLGISKNARSSWVLVTTQNQNVAFAVGTPSEHIHKIGLLKEDDCLSIIKHRAFGNPSTHLEDLECVAKVIANKCGGLPLVANVIGGTLRHNRGENAWLSISEKLEAWGSIEELGVGRVLQLSFDRLPEPALKQCFAFSSIFDKNTLIEKEMLIQLWMAQGFLQPSEESSMDMEAIGDEYFNYLLSCSLFQDARRDSYGRIIACKMHDLMRCLAQFVSKHAALVLENGCVNNAPVIGHLNLLGDAGMVPTEEGDAIQKMHTLFLKGNVFAINTSVNFKRLLALSFCGADIDKLPSLLGKLKCLRYLDISETKIKKLPQFISRLYLLQTFRFMNCNLIRKPLKGIVNLIQLRHIYFNDEKYMPAKIGKLTCLRTLQLFVVGRQKGRRIEELGCLSKLRGKLKICHLENVRSRADASMAKLSEKTGVYELVLKFVQENGEEERCQHDAEVLEGLQPPKEVNSLTVIAYCGEKCPSWMLESAAGYLPGSTFIRSLKFMKFDSCFHLKSIPLVSLSKLEELEIICCKKVESIEVSYLSKLSIASCDELVRIAMNPESLKELHIQRCAVLESLPVIGGLPSLQILCLEDCSKLSSIGDNESFASTSLQKLRLHKCPNLSIPSIDGLSFLQEVFISSCEKLQSMGRSLSTSKCLKELTIKQCPSLMSVPNGLSFCTALKKLTIKECQDLISIPDELKKLHFLVELNISKCRKLRSFPWESLGHLLHLEELQIGGFSEELEVFRDLNFFQHLSSSLESLFLIGWEKLKDLPPRIQCLTALRLLNMEELNDLTAFPEWLGNLSSLQILKIHNCRNLVHMPSIQFMEQLSNLHLFSIEGCPKLKVQSVRESVSAWPSIPHVRNITIDNEVIQSRGAFDEQDDDRQVPYVITNSDSDVHDDDGEDGEEENEFQLPPWTRPLFCCKY